MEEQPEYYINGFGNKYWYLPSRGKHYLHREDGPAFESANGTKLWWLNCLLHRLSGPAVEGESEEWWIDGTHLFKDEVEEWIEENNVDLKTEAGQMAFKLRWA